MPFNSYEFIFVFLPAVVLSSFYLSSLGGPLLTRSWLLLASFVFYGWWNTRDLPLLAVSVTLNYLLGRTLVRRARSTAPLARRKRVLVLAVALNLSLLAAFKYSGLFVWVLRRVFGLDAPHDLVLPLGISFFTFTQIAYLVDAYRGQAEEYRFVDYALFVTFFPHLMAGPILYHKAILPQLERADFSRPSSANISAGLFLFTIGLFKKVILADTVATWANSGFANAHALNFLEAWTTVLSYTLQLYFDFAGYTDMAIGVARMF